MAEITRNEVGSRAFRFTYEVKVSALPASAKRVEIWLPLPAEANQVIRRLEIEGSGPVETRYTRDSGDRYAYMRVNPPAGEVLLRHVVELVREEVRAREGYLANRSVVEDIDRVMFQPYLASDPFLPINDEVRRIAREQASGLPTVVAKARALYDWVAEKMQYDKRGKGWGLGDIEYCLKVGKGNCTDFHSLFIVLARAAGIPARWNIGFPISYRRDTGKSHEVKGYHCWAEFFLPGSGWIPVDISEGDKHPELRDYFFGNLSGNRILYTRGRNLALEPSPEGKRLNYFIYPRVLVDGRPYGNVTRAFAYRNLP